MNWRRTFWTCALCISLLMQGMAAVAAAPACTHHNDPTQLTAGADMPPSHHPHHGASDATSAHPDHLQAQHAGCDCDQECAGSCIFHAPGQLLPDDLLAMSAPHPDAFPLRADERPYPTVVAPRLRPPTPS